MDCNCDESVKSFSRRIWKAMKNEFENAKIFIGTKNDKLTYNELYWWMQRTFGWNKNEIISRFNFR